MSVGKKILVLILCIGLAPNLASAQATDAWTLQRCVDYAIAHNISVQQSVLNERLAELQLKQSRLSQIPNANLTSAYGRSYGRSVDPTTNQFVSGDYDFLSLAANTDVLLFGWFQRRNTIAKNNLSYQASVADLDQLKDDISLNVATGFLRAVLAKEQIGVNEKQVALSKQQADQTKRFVESGRLPQLNLSQVASQLATDSSNLISAIGDYTSSLLDLKALLNLDFEVPFDVSPPDVSSAVSPTFVGYTAQQIYTEALQHFGAVKSATLKYQAAQKALAASKGALYPQLSFSGQVGSNYATTFKEYGAPTQAGTQTVGSITVAGTNYDIQTPVYTVNALGTIPLNNQINNNLRQTYAFNLSIPLFNGWQASAAVKQQAINVQSQDLNKYNASLKLKQDVYKAYNDVRNAYQKYLAAQRADEAAREAQDFATQRYGLGLTNTVDYLATQNQAYRAAASLESARYDYIFRLKVIDYYLGKPLAL